MAASALIVGFMAGFFGIGGGLLMVPIFFYIFSYVGVEHEFVMHLVVDHDMEAFDAGELAGRVMRRTWSEEE